MNQSCVLNYWQDVSRFRPSKSAILLLSSAFHQEIPHRRKIVQLPVLCRDKVAIVLLVNEEIKLCSYGCLDVIDAERFCCLPFIPILDFSEFVFPIRSKRTATSVVFTALNFTTFQRCFSFFQTLTVLFRLCRCFSFLVAKAEHHKRVFTDFWSYLFIFSHTQFEDLGFFLF